MLGAAHPDEPTASLVLRAAETVFELYTEDPALSVRRFALTHRVPALRDRESAGVDHYRRLFTRQLRERMAGTICGPRSSPRAWWRRTTWRCGSGSRRAAHRPTCPALLARFRSVADLLPGDPGLTTVTDRLEAAVGRLERTATR